MASDFFSCWIEVCITKNSVLKTYLKIKRTTRSDTQIYQQEGSEKESRHHHPLGSSGHLSQQVHIARNQDLRWWATSQYRFCVQDPRSHFICTERSASPNHFPPHGLTYSTEDNWRILACIFTTSSVVTWWSIKESSTRTWWTFRWAWIRVHIKQQCWTHGFV